MMMKTMHHSCWFFDPTRFYKKNHCKHQQQSYQTRSLFFKSILMCFGSKVLLIRKNIFFEEQYQFFSIGIYQIYTILQKFIPKNNSKMVEFFFLKRKN
ncbi:hypothetical protein C2G38_2059815 [Gigaspora rosea]|uniref:Uncharacterized protein n=1 Tax=Gigaspora rosea TaxID=44941 RepID=A0A397W0I6_9GLOM|nr:hypothetical protein C2G38_2059815 [Gigaspora rosea]